MNEDLKKQLEECILEGRELIKEIREVFEKLCEETVQSIEDKK